MIRVIVSTTGPGSKEKIGACSKWQHKKKGGTRFGAQPVNNQKRSFSEGDEKKLVKKTPQKKLSKAAPSPEGQTSVRTLRTGAMKVVAVAIDNEVSNEIKKILARISTGLRRDSDETVREKDPKNDGKKKKN